LDTPASRESASTIGDALPDAGRDDDLDRRIMLWAALHTLSARDRMIVYLRFFEDLSQQGIADRLGVSQMHVSRLLRRTLERLHLAIGA
jgi:RNA polymerase sigma-B factor